MHVCMCVYIVHTHVKAYTSTHKHTPTLIPTKDALKRFYEIVTYVSVFIHSSKNMSNPYTAEMFWIFP